MRYVLTAFSQASANAGKLCAIVRYSAESGGEDDEENSGGSTTELQPEGGRGSTRRAGDPTFSIVMEDTNPRFVGTGVCRKYGSGYCVTCNNTDYYFNINGYGNSNVSGDMQLFMAIPDASTSWSEAGSSVSIDDNIYDVDSLNARDQFAVHALREIMAKIKDPASLDDATIYRYCESAYKWASTMLYLSAKLRTVNSSTPSEEQGN